MFREYKVVSVTPAGRARYMELLSSYLLRERNIIDYHEWWVNTDVTSDIAFIEDLHNQYPDFFRVVRAPDPVPEGTYQRLARIDQWYRRCVAPDTIYLKIDDDIVYIGPGAVQALLDFRVRNPLPFLVYPCIVNNPCISHLLQRQGAIPLGAGVCHYDPVGRGWNDGPFAEIVHRSFLHDLRRNDLRRWMFDEFHLMYYERISINFIAWFGRDFAPFGGLVSGDDEHVLSCVKPKELQRPNIVYGQPLVAHFSFLPQREHLEKTELLERYRSVAQLSRAFTFL